MRVYTMPKYTQKSAHFSLLGSSFYPHPQNNQAHSPAPKIQNSALVDVRSVEIPSGLLESTVTSRQAWSR